MAKKWISRIGPLICICVVLSVLALAYAYFIEPDRLVVNRTELKIRNWNPAFDGLKVVVLADIHGGSNSIDEAKLREIVAITNAQDADLVVMLGDYVSQKREDKPITERSLKMPIETIATNLIGITAKYGVLAVLGNHDGWYNDELVRRELTRAGIRVLENEVAVIERNGQKLRILGLPDHMKIGSWKGFSDSAKQVLSNDGQTGDVLVLEHSPDVLPIITDKLSISPDLRVILAAHTHGGQVWLPVFGTPVVPSSYGQKYSYGHIRENDVDMFVSTGIGTSILPIRFMMPPEIAVLTLRSE